MTDLKCGETVFIECVACKQEFAVTYEPRTETPPAVKVRIEFCPSCGSDSVLFETPKPPEADTPNAEVTGAKRPVQ